MKLYIVLSVLSFNIQSLFNCLLSLPYLFIDTVTVYTNILDFIKVKHQLHIKTFIKLLNIFIKAISLYWHSLFHIMAYFYVIYRYVISVARPVEINQYAHCEITMGNITCPAGLMKYPYQKQWTWSPQMITTNLFLFLCRTTIDWMLILMVYVYNFTEFTGETAIL